MTNFLNIDDIEFNNLINSFKIENNNKRIAHQSTIFKTVSNSSKKEENIDTIWNTSRSIR